MSVQILEKCPACDGTGKIRPTILLTDDIENNLGYLVREQNEKSLTLVVHPYLHAFLTHGWFNFKWKWWRKYGQLVTIKPQNASHFLEYHFLNKNGDEIKM